MAEHRAVSVQDAQQYAEENGILFIETSAKTASNVNELFVNIGTSLAPPSIPFKNILGAHFARESGLPTITGPAGADFRLQRTPIPLNSL